MFFKRLSRLTVFLALLASSSGLSFAQGTDLGNIRGTVKDASGGVIPQAKVTVTDLSTGTAREIATNEHGEYEVFGLNFGRYKVSVSAPGLATEEIDGVVVSGTETVTVDATLQVSKTQSVVEVAADVAPIHTEDQTISSTLNNQAVIELPRDSRDIFQFLYLNPNITQSGEPGDFKFLGFQSYGASVSLDGQRSNGGIFGSPTASEPSLEAVGELNVLSNDFSAEYPGIATIRVTTKRGTEKYHGSLFYNNKNSALAAWNLQDKIAAASFAPTPFQSSYPTPFFNINDVGGSLGGPIPGLKKNTWFFIAYEHNSTITPDTIESSDLPHPSLLQGNFSLLDNSAKPDVPAAILPLLTPQEIATDTVGGLGQQFIQIPQRLLNPSVQKLISLYFPKIGMSAPIDPATGRVPDYSTLVSASGFTNLGTLRLDHDFSERDHVFLTYNASALSSSGLPSEENSPNTGFVGQPYTGLGLTQEDRRNDTVSLSYTRIIKPNIVNELRGGFNRQELFYHSNTTLSGFLSSVGFNQDEINAYGSAVGTSELSTFGQPAISFAGTFATFPNGGRSTDRPENQNLQTFGDTLNWVVGTHNFKMGADFVRNEAVDGFAVNRGNVRGLMTYSGSGTDPLADWLMGLPPTSVSYVEKARPPMNVHNWETGYFFQDDWKVSPRLTLNLGVRYELITPFIEANDLLANFDPNLTNPNTGQPGVFIIPSDRALKYLDPRIISYGYILASQAGVGRGLIHMDTNNIAPRFGFAWRIGDKNVLRGGWGVYYPTSAAQGIRDPIATNPFNAGVTYRNPNGDTPLGGWPGNPEGGNLMTGGTLNGVGNTPSANFVPLNLQQPRIQQYNVTFERDLGWNTALRLSYLGTAMHGLIAGKDLDEIPPSNNPFGTTIGDGVTPCDPVNLGNCALSPQDMARLPFPQLAEFVLSYGNFGHGLMNAFQTQVEHRFTNHLMFSAAYTYMSENSTALDTDNSSLGGVAYDIFDPDSDYGPEGYVSKNRVVGYGIYDLPVGRHRQFGSNMPKWLDAFIGGWQTSFNMFAKSGTGFTPFWICDDCDPIEPGNVAVGSIDAVGDFGAEPSFRPLVIGNYNQHVGDAIWNAAAFAPPPVGADLFSNPEVAKRNMLWGPSTWGVNLGVHKYFSVTERVKAELGADIDNLFNHPLLSPDENYGGGGGNFAYLGDFNLQVNQTTGQLLPITDITFLNPDFGRLINSFEQEGIDSRRSIRLRLRITW